MKLKQTGLVNDAVSMSRRSGVSIRRMTLLCFFAVMCAAAWSESVTFVTSSSGDWRGNSITDAVTKSGVTLNFGSGTLNKDYISSPSLTVKGSSAFTSISVYFSRKDGFGISSVTNGGGTVENPSSFDISVPSVWTGSSSSVGLSFNSKVRIAKIVVETSLKPAPVLTLSGTKSSMLLADGPFKISVSATVGGTQLSGLSYTFASSNTGVATVDADGTVTPKGAGTTTISATYDGSDEYNSASASFNLTVQKEAGALSEYDENRPLGWAENVTGGEGGKVFLADTRAKFISALQGEAPAIVYVKGTIYFNGADTLFASKNKTIIGLPGAKLQNAVPRYGTLEDNSNYAGGAYKTKIEEGKATPDDVWAWIKTAMDVDSTGILCLMNCDNIIIRNLSFESEGDFDIDGKDNLTLHGTTNIWVDHCAFQDGIDGNFDCIHGSDNIAVTWCHFFYEKESRTEVENGVTGDAGGGHKDSNLWGHNDNNGAEDEGHLNTTFANCWWGKMCKDRMPRVRFGKVHIYNCLYDTDNDKISACIASGHKADVMAENCVFENAAAKKGKQYKTSGTGIDGGLQLKSWIVGGKLQDDLTLRNGSYAPSYSYKSYDVSLTKEVVTDPSTGAGPTLDYAEPDETDDPTAVDVTTKNEYASFCSAYPLDFSNVTGLKAYVATELVKKTYGDVLLQSVKLKQVDKVPGGEGVILKGEAGQTYSVPVMDGNAESIAANYLRGTVSKKFIGMNYDYYLDESCAFHHKVSDDFVLRDGKIRPCYPGYIAAGKSYLASPMGTIVKYSYGQLSSAYASLIIDDEATGVRDIDTSSREDDAWYTLTGVRVQHPQKGIYIHNGKKVVVR